MNKQSNQNTNQKGFTLVELLIVLAVLGIIAAIAVPRFMNIQQGFVNKTDTSTAQLWAHDIEAAFVSDLLDDLSSNKLTIQTGTLAGYQGTIPKLPSDKTKLLIAEIVYDTTAKTYTLSIYPGDLTKTALVTKTIAPPVK